MYVNIMHNDPIVAAEMRLVKNATSSIRESKRTATLVMTGEDPRCTAITKKGRRCGNPRVQILRILTSVVPTRDRR